MLLHTQTFGRSLLLATATLRRPARDLLLLAVATPVRVWKAYRYADAARMREEATRRRNLQTLIEESHVDVLGGCPSCPHRVGAHDAAGCAQCGCSESPRTIQQMRSSS